MKSSDLQSWSLKWSQKVCFHFSALWNPRFLCTNNGFTTLKLVANNFWWLNYTIQKKNSIIFLSTCTYAPEIPSGGHASLGTIQQSYRLNLNMVTLKFADKCKNCLKFKSLKKLPKNCLTFPVFCVKILNFSSILDKIPTIPVCSNFLVFLRLENALPFFSGSPVGVGTMLKQVFGIVTIKY